MATVLGMICCIWKVLFLVRSGHGSVDVPLKARGSVDGLMRESTENTFRIFARLENRQQIGRGHTDTVLGGYSVVKASCLQAWPKLRCSAKMSGSDLLPVLSIMVILSPQPAWPLLQQQVWCLGPHSCPHSGAQLPAHRAEPAITHSTADSSVSVPDLSENPDTIVDSHCGQVVEFL